MSTFSQVTRGKTHEPNAFRFDGAHFFPFPTVAIAATQAITVVAAIYSLPASVKIWGCSVYCDSTTTVSAFDIRMDSTTFSAVAGNDSTHISGETEANPMSSFPIANATVKVVSGTNITSIVYKPLATSGNSFANATGGITGTFSAGTQTFSSVVPDLIYPKGHVLLLSYVTTGGTGTGNMQVTMFGKIYDTTPYKPNLSVLNYGDIG